MVSRNWPQPLVLNDLQRDTIFWAVSRSEGKQRDSIFKQVSRSSWSPVSRPLPPRRRTRMAAL